MRANNYLRILYLPIEKKWFDMIASGIKKQEYRDITPYYIVRLIKPSHTEQYLYDHFLQLVTLNEITQKATHMENFRVKPFDVVCFINGYGHHRPHLTMELLEISCGIGKPEWGAPDRSVFILDLGKEVDRKNF